MWQSAEDALPPGFDSGISLTLSGGIFSNPMD